MSEWKKLTAEQVAWLDARAPITCRWVEFRFAEDVDKLGWQKWERGDGLKDEGGVFFKLVDHTARPADFPMGEAERAQDITQHIAKAQADAEWQRERRAAWVASANSGLESSDVDRCVESRRIIWADWLLAEFDKRFGGDK